MLNSPFSESWFVLSIIDAAKEGPLQSDFYFIPSARAVFYGLFSNLTAS
jgi:hypothetical protein